MECPECGRKLRHGKNRCIYCGGVATETADPPAGRPGTEGPGDRTDAGGWAPEGTTSRMDGASGGEKDPSPGGAFDRTRGSGMDQRDIVRWWGIKPPRRRRPMGYVLQVIIFFGSAAIVGALVWLLR